MWMVLPAAGAVLLAALGYAYAMHLPEAEPDVIRVSGNIEVTDAEVGFKIAGLVEERLVSEGALIRRDEVVASLETSDLACDVAARQAELRLARAILAELEAGSRPEEIEEARASVDKARAYLTELENGSRPEEVAAAEAAVERATADLADAESNYVRLKDLYERQVSAPQEFDTAKARYEAAVARLREAREQYKLVLAGPRQERIDQAQAALAQARERFKLVKKGPREETIEQSRARVEQAVAALRLAETRLGYATVRSPLTGVVLSENVEPGEYVAPGTPVVTVGDLENVWLRAYVNETDLGRVKVGQSVRVTTDTYPDKTYPGHISFVASEAEFTPKNVQTEKERVKLVYRIKIDIRNRSMELKPGMPADAEIVLDGATGAQ